MSRLIPPWGCIRSRRVDVLASSVARSRWHCMHRPSRLQAHSTGLRHSRAVMGRISTAFRGTQSTYASAAGGGKYRSHSSLGLRSWCRCGQEGRWSGRSSRVSEWRSHRYTVQSFSADNEASEMIAAYCCMHRNYSILCITHCQDK